MIRDSESGIKLVAARESQFKGATSEKLTIENCIKLTEQLIPNYSNLKEYKRTSKALSHMKSVCTSEQSARIQTLVDEAMEMSKVLSLSVKTAQCDRQQDFGLNPNTSIFHAILSANLLKGYVANIPTYPTSQPSDDDIYGNYTQDMNRPLA